MDLFAKGTTVVPPIITVGRTIAINVAINAGNLPKYSVVLEFLSE